MCVYSMVMDHWQPIIPAPAQPIVDWEKVRKDLDAFRQAEAAAKLIDQLTGKPDCVDPEKAKLLARVKELEHELESIKLREHAGKLEGAIRRIRIMWSVDTKAPIGGFDGLHDAIMYAFGLVAPNGKAQDDG